jgi:hypothetical protein
MHISLKDDQKLVLYELLQRSKGASHNWEQHCTRGAFQNEKHAAQGISVQFKLNFQSTRR